MGSTLCKVFWPIILMGKGGKQTNELKSPEIASDAESLT